MVDKPTQPKQKAIVGLVDQMLVEGKGFISEDADIDKRIAIRFGELDLINTTGNKLAFFNVVLSSDSRYADYISTCILEPDVLYKYVDAGVSFMNLLKLKNIIPGVCIDMGLMPLYLSKTEYVTESFDDLGERCKQYIKDGCNIGKWRTVFRIDNVTPSHLAIEINCLNMARFSALCQHADMVPILEIDFINESDSDLEYVQQSYQRVMGTLISELIEMNVLLEALILQTCFVRPGQKCQKIYTMKDMALATVEMLRRTIPPAIKGITFLSTDFDETDATTILNAVNQVPLEKPWRLTFAYGRALTSRCLRIWGGLETCEKAAQIAFLNRCRANSFASRGIYDRSRDMHYRTIRHFNCKNFCCRRK